MLTSSMTGGGGHIVPPSSSTFSSGRVPPSSSATAGGGGGGTTGAYDLSQWMPDNCCGGCNKVVCRIRGVSSDPNFTEALRIANAFSRHEACVGSAQSWQVEGVAMSDAGFEKWLNDSAEELKEMKNGERAVAHRLENGPLVTLGEYYVGSTPHLREYVRKAILLYREARDREAYAQRRRQLVALGILILLFGICYVALQMLIARNEAHRTRLISFYETYNPDKLNDLDAIDAILRKYKGREESLFARLAKKYNIEL